MARFKNDLPHMHTYPDLPHNWKDNPRDLDAVY